MNADGQLECIGFGTGIALRVASWVGVAGFATAAVLIVALDGAKPWGDRLGGAFFLWLGALSCYVLGIRPGVEICGDEVLVRRYFSNLRFPTGELTHATGSSTLWLHRTSGSAVGVRGVATDNITLMRGKKGRAERVAEAINDHLGAQAEALGNARRRTDGFNWRVAFGVLLIAAVQIGLLLLRLAIE